MEKTDILIIGSGLAGLFLAIKTAQKRPDLSIVIMTKSLADTGNTRYAQGGIATVTDLVNDSYEQHIQDTLSAGGGCCNEKIVRMVVQQAPDRIEELLTMGIAFDTKPSGIWDLGLEGGHSRNRILHHKDISGLEIERKLLAVIPQLPNIRLLENQLCVDLSTEKDKTDQEYCSGVFYFNKTRHRIKHIRARSIVLSTGGCGQLFKNTTNPEVATGDGVAMAYRAGAAIEQLHYIQFHPTALYEANKHPFFLLSEALRGFGAYVVDENQKRFLFKYDTRGELATRDIVSQAINSELEKTGKKHVYLDCRHLDYDAFYRHFPTITDYCRTIGLNPQEDLIPVVPAAHYQCGGITVDQHSRTTVKNLYAIGECSCTGLHGKNRLASNSLLEALVFAHQGSEHICNTIDTIAFSSLIFMNKQQSVLPDNPDSGFAALKEELQQAMTAFYTDKEAKTALNIIKQLKTTADQINSKQKITPSFIELINMLTVASLIVEQTKHSKNVTQLT